MKENQKDITVGVTDENNRLQYQWKFNSDTITQPDMDIDLTISFDTDREMRLRKLQDVMILCIFHSVITEHYLDQLQSRHMLVTNIRMEI